MEITYLMKQILVDLELNKGASIKQVRMSLEGKEDGNPNIMREISEKAGTVTSPLHCEFIALIKNPTKITEMTYTNRARGILGLYSFTGNPMEKYSIFQKFSKILEQKSTTSGSFSKILFRNSLICTDFEDIDDLEYEQDRFVLILKFTYIGETYATSKSMPGELRRTIVDDPKGVPKLTEMVHEVAKIENEKWMYCESFALIKKSTENLGKSTDTAIGAMGIFHFTGPLEKKKYFLDCFRHTVHFLVKSEILQEEGIQVDTDLFHRSLERKPKGQAPGKFKECRDYQILVGVNLENVEE